MRTGDMEGTLDFYCNGYRYFHDIEETEKHYQQICNTPSERQWYGQDVVEFESVTELNTTIQKLTALRNAVNGNNFNDSHIQREFGNNGIDYNIKRY